MKTKVVIFSLCLFCLLFFFLKFSGYSPILNFQLLNMIHKKGVYSAHTNYISISQTSSTNQKTVDIDLLIQAIMLCTKKPKIKEGFIRSGEKLSFIDIEVKKNDKSYLTVEFSWDRGRKVMELRIDSVYGQMKQRFYNLNDDEASKIFFMLTNMT